MRSVRGMLQQSKTPEIGIPESPKPEPDRRCRISSLTIVPSNITFRAHTFQEQRSHSSQTSSNISRVLRTIIIIILYYLRLFIFLNICLHRENV